MKIFFLFFLSLNALALPDNLYLENNCVVFSSKGKIVQSFAGAFCQFLPDGRYFSGSDKKVVMFGADDNVIWELPLVIHHQVNLSSDGQRILTLAQEIRKSDRGNLRVDKFVILSLDGKILHEADATELLKNKLPLTTRHIPTTNKKSKEIEDTHFNSIYEIPKNSSKLAFLKEGNIIVNTLGLGACVLSPDLKIVLDCRKFSDSIDHQVHDVQITSEGKYLYFNNEVPGRPELRSSGADELDPARNKVTFRFAAKPASMFYSPICGGAQVLSKDLLLVSHMTNGVYVVNRKNYKLVEYISTYAMGADLNWISQRFRAVYLDAFFNARKKK